MVQQSEASLGILSVGLRWVVGLFEVFERCLVGVLNVAIEARSSPDKVQQSEVRLGILSVGFTGLSRASAGAWAVFGAILVVTRSPKRFPRCVSCTLVCS